MAEADPPPGPAPPPGSVPVTEAGRQAVIDRIHQALAEDLIDFSEIDHRFEQVDPAITPAQLDHAAKGLAAVQQPPPPRTTRHPAPSANFALVGDIKTGGWISVASTIRSTLIGDALIDLSSAEIPAEGVNMSFRSLIGDLRVIVPDVVGLRKKTV